MSIYTNNYPDVIITKKRIGEVEHLLAESKGGAAKKWNEKDARKTREPIDVEDNSEFIDLKSQLVTTEAQIVRLKKRAVRIKKQIKKYERRVEDTPAKEQKLASILRDYDISQKNYHSLLGKKLNARLAENLEKRQKGERFKVIDPANLPEKPFKPNKLMIIIIGMIVGTTVGGGFVYFLEFLNPCFRSAEDFIGVLPIPVLATVQKFPKTPSKQFRNKLKEVKLGESE